MQLLNVDQLLQLTPLQLSGGEKKRVAFLFCVLKNSKTYMLDEPTASLNKEYSTAMAQILIKLKNLEKRIIIFTHDQLLMDIADNHYRIENNELKPIKMNDKPENYQVEKNVNGLNLNCLVPFFKKIKHAHKKTVKAISLFVIILSVIAAFSLNYSRTVHRAQQDTLNKMMNTELTAYKGVITYSIVDGSLGYSFNGLERPLSEKDEDIISKIDHVARVEWRYDFTEYDIFSDDIAVYPRDGDNTRRPFQMIIDGREVISEEEVILSTYLKDAKDTSNIEVDFGGNGIYMSRFLANYIEDTLGLADEDLNNAMMTINVSVPVYNTYGKFKGISDNEETMFINNTTVVYEQLTLPISGILKWSTFGIDDYSRYVVYIERDDMEKLIEKNKRIADRTIYRTIDSSFRYHEYSDIC